MKTTNRFLGAIALSLLCSVALLAQSATPAAPVTPVVNAVPAPVYPSYFVSFGGGYTRNATPQAAEGFISAAIGLGGGNYSITTVDMTASSSTIRTGFAKMFSQSGNFTLLGRVDAGISTVTPVIGSFSGGAVFMYNLKGVSPKLVNTFAFLEARITGASTATTATPNQVTPGFYFGIGKSF
jgi:hypothetical protein